MQIEVKDIDQCVKELTITVPKEDVQNDYSKEIRRFSNHVVVPGYRKGKAPLSMVAAMFDSNIRRSFLNEKIPDYLNKAMDEKGLHSVCEPEVLDLKWEPNEDIVAVMRIEVAPKIEITQYTGLEIPYKYFKFEENMIDDYLEKMRKEQVEVEKDAEIIDETCRVIFTGSFLSEDKKDIELPPDLTELSVSEHNFGEELTKAIIGAKKDDVIETVVDWNGSEKEPVRLTVTSIMKFTYPEVNDDFAKRNGAESLEDLRKLLRDDVQQYLDRQNLTEKVTAIGSALVRANHFDLPPSLVKEYSKQRMQMYADYYNLPVEDLVERYYATALEEMKRSFAVEQLIEKLNLEPTEEAERLVLEETAEGMKLTVDEYLERNPDVTKQDDFVERVKKHQLYDYLEANNKLVIKEEEEKTV